MVGPDLGPAAETARRKAAAQGLRYVAVSRGLYASIRPEETPVSLLFDPLGTPADARRPSAVEQRIATGEGLDAGLIERARSAMDLIRRLRLSQANWAPRLDPGLLPRGPAVIVVDEARRHPAVAAGLADAGRFATMLAAARAEHPQATILIIRDPATIGAGHLDGAGGANLVSAGAVDPWSALEHAQAVYAVTSEIGFSALLAGLPVTLFGAPFYAGWGLTDDRISVPRRSARPELASLFAAHALVHSHWYDPWRGTETSFEDAVEKLAFVRDRFHENDRRWVLSCIARWKRHEVAAALDGPAGRPIFARSRREAVERGRQHNGRIAHWVMYSDRGLSAAAAEAGVPLASVEDGFLRSVGLGSAFLPPASIVVDATGIYYDPRRPSDLERILATHPFEAALLERARALRERLVELGLSKYNVGAHAELDIPRDRPVVLVVGQVDDDRSVVVGAPDVGGNLGLLKAARARNPDAFLIYKPHPDVVAGYRIGHIPQHVTDVLADLVISDVSIVELFPLVDRVETMSSLAGFEALLRGIPVTCHGRPFYAGWGLTEDLVACERRGRRLELDALVAGTLILYPRYLDPVSMRPCPPEFVVERLAEAMAAERAAGISGRKRIRNTVVRLRHQLLGPIGRALR